MRTTLVPYLSRRSTPADLFSEVDRLFESFTHWPTPYERFSTESTTFETSEGDDHFLVTCDLPGMKKEALKIEVKDRTLTIQGERRGVTFERRLRIPESVESENIEARYEDGVLDIYLPKRPETQPRTIALQSGESKGVFAKLFSRKDDTKALAGQMKQ